MKNMTLRESMLSAMFVAIICVLTYISIPLPFSPVPITGQTLGIMLVGMILSTNASFVTLLVYILIGAIGLPVFSGASGGLGVLFGPTGGYIFGFLIGAVIISYIAGKSTDIKKLIIAGFVGGILVVDLIGMTWLGFSTGMGLKKAFFVGVLPFLIGDGIKLVLSALIASKLKKHLSHMG